MTEIKPGDRVRTKLGRKNLLVIENMGAHRVKVIDLDDGVRVNFARYDVELDPEAAAEAKTLKLARELADDIGMDTAMAEDVLAEFSPSAARRLKALLAHLNRR